MSDGFVKLFGSILQSTIWLECPETKVVWVTMLALSTKDGEVHASIPGLARTAGVSLEACEAALNKFLSPDPYSRTKDFDGKRIREIDGGWIIINHAKYRDKQTRKQEVDAKRQARHREVSRTVTHCHAVSRDVTQCHAMSHEVAPYTYTYTDLNKTPPTPPRGDCTTEPAVLEEAKPEKPKPEPDPDRMPAEEKKKVIAQWNACVAGTPFPEIQAIGKSRERHLKARLRENPKYMDRVVEVMGFIKDYEFLNGTKGYLADFDWAMKPDKLGKQYERMVASKKAYKPSPTSDDPYAGMQPWERAKAVNEAMGLF